MTIKILISILLCLAIITAFFVGLSFGRHTIKDPESEEICNYSESHMILKSEQTGNLQIRTIKTVVCDKEVK